MVFIALGVLSTRYSFAQPSKKGKTHQITITNLTRNQIFSPPIVISHDDDYELFSPGTSAEPELVALAEDGNAGPLTNLIDTLPSVFDYAVAGAALLPGESVTLEVNTRGKFRKISAAGMLVTTNDGFFAVSGVTIQGQRGTINQAVAYDAGSEINSEDCAYIPGPPCGNVAHDAAEAEGYIHIHAGIHGIADLAPESYDWRNPVAEIRSIPAPR